MNLYFIQSSTEWPEDFSQAKVVECLHSWLKPFEDSPSAITKAIDYAFSTHPGCGGGVFLIQCDDRWAGAAVVNRTGMQEYIPENILVYIAVDPAFRKRGLGSQLIFEVLGQFPGSFKLHVELNNPAKALYERLGFKHRYAEMRYQR